MGIVETALLHCFGMLVIIVASITCFNVVSSACYAYTDSCTLSSSGGTGVLIFSSSEKLQEWEAEWIYHGPVSSIKIPDVDVISMDDKKITFKNKKDDGNVAAGEEVRLSFTFETDPDSNDKQGRFILNGEQCEETNPNSAQSSTSIDKSMYIYFLLFCNYFYIVWH